MIQQRNMRSAYIVLSLPLGARTEELRVSLGTTLTSSVNPMLSRKTALHRSVAVRPSGQ